jgi:DNA-binding beta-propeller fold protein YncE
VISGNENKIDLTSGVARVIPDAAPDSLSVLDFSEFPPRVENVVGVPNTVIGPPSNIAITPDGRTALVGNSVRLDAGSSTGFVPESQIHVVNLESRPPRVVSTVAAGQQPSGISITRDGRHALVANRAEGTISSLAISGDRVELIESVKVCEAAESVSDVAIHPDDRLVLASVQKGGYLAVLELRQGRLHLTGRKISVYGQPYRCVITPDGELGLTAGQGMGNGVDSDALSVVDLRSDPIRTIDYVPLGAVPESFEVSPDGRLVAAVTMSGSNLSDTDPNYSPNGEVILLSRRGSSFRRSHGLTVGRIPEGVAFTSDGRYLVVQCHPDRQLWVFAVRRGRLRDTGVRVDVPGMPSSLRASP